ncbi:rRNA maturation RNase YbeY [Candidatus Latescibacterota bacterium]
MMDVSVIVSEGIRDFSPLDNGNLRTFAVNVLKSRGVRECEINIVFIGDSDMTSLNEKYKRRKGSTDVLSFKLSDVNSENIEGEVYISLDRAREQAVNYNVLYEEEIVRLVTHGLLHLTGRKHDSKEAYETMVKDTDTLVDNYFKSGDIQ